MNKPSNITFYFIRNCFSSLLQMIGSGRSVSFGYWMILMAMISFSCDTGKPEETKKEEQSISADGKVIMAVFAHPDDELSIGPLMAKYAREGATVQLVTVTDGRYGTGQTDLKPGDELTVLRNEEVNTAAAKMGIEKPIWMGYHDQLKLKDGFFGHVPYVQQLMVELDSLVRIIEPDVIITWGPDGGSNHMDHRLVGASMTQVFLSKMWQKPKMLYYVGSPASHIEDEENRILRGIADEYLTTVIDYTEEDRERAIEAMYCYKSQFAKDLMDSRAERWRNGDQKIYLRPLIRSSVKSDNVFEVINP